MAFAAIFLMYRVRHMRVEVSDISSVYSLDCGEGEGDGKGSRSKPLGSLMGNSSSNSSMCDESELMERGRAQDGDEVGGGEGGECPYAIARRATFIAPIGAALHNMEETGDLFKQSNKSPRMAFQQVQINDNINSNSNSNSNSSSSRNKIPPALPPRRSASTSSLSSTCTSASTATASTLTGKQRGTLSAAPSSYALTTPSAFKTIVRPYPAIVAGETGSNASPLMFSAAAIAAAIADIDDHDMCLLEQASAAAAAAAVGASDSPPVFEESPHHTPNREGILSRRLTEKTIEFVTFDDTTA
jgi:hypothetical protein